MRTFSTAWPDSVDTTSAPSARRFSQPACGGTNLMHCPDGSEPRGCKGTLQKSRAHSVARSRRSRTRHLHAKLARQLLSPEARL